MTRLLQRVERFVVAGEGDFGELAGAAARFGYERVEPYRRLCDRRGIAPEALDDWREAPPVPTSAFKSLRLAAAEPREVFRSSGTTRGAERRSVHHHPYPALYRAVIDATFAAACLPARGHDRRGHSRADDGARSRADDGGGESRNTGEGDGDVGAGSGGRLPILSLIPDRAAAPDSSLSFMAAHVFERHAAPGSVWAVQEAGIDLDRACRWLADRSTTDEPALILATALALVLLLDRLEDLAAAPAAAGSASSPSPRASAAAVPTRLDRAPVSSPGAAGPAGRPVRLPAGSRVFETGGFKGRRMATTPEDVRRRARNLLGLDRQAIVREYGMTELTSQAYSRPGGERLRTPPWMPFRVLDPDTLEEVEDGETGLLAFFDLANLGSVCHVLTEDLGVREGDAFRLLGRASGAELRGCSLTAEELGAA